MKKVRNILNLIFIVLAVVGMLLYYQGSTSVGGTIIIVAMAFKFVEVCLRIVKKDDE